MPILRNRGRSSVAPGGRRPGLPGVSTWAPVKAPYHRPVATRQFLPDSKVTSTRLSETMTSWRASWQSPSSSFQCFHSDRLYPGISAGTADTVMDRTFPGLVSGVAEGGACSRVGMGVDVPVEEAGDGVAVAVTDSGVGRGVGVGSAGFGVVGTGSEVCRHGC